MTTTWIAIFSNDLDGESIKELEIEAATEAEVQKKLAEIEYDSNWLNYSVSSIRKKRGGVRPGAGRPKGKARAGTYGEGVATKPVRVPVEIAGRLPEVLQNLEQLGELLSDWENEASKSTSPRYDRAKKLLSEIRALGF